MYSRYARTKTALVVGVLLVGARASLRAGDGDMRWFPRILVANTTGVPDANFIGPPDDIYGNVADQQVIYEFDCGVIEDGPGADFNVYEVDFGVPEFERMDVLVSANGTNFVSVKITEGDAIRIPGDEAHDNNWSNARSYDLDGSGLSLVRFVWIDGLVAGNAFDLDAIGAIHYVDTCDSDGDGVDNELDVCPNTPMGTLVDTEGRPVGDVDRDCDSDLVDCALATQGMTGPLDSPVAIETVSVGNPGNPDDTYRDGDGAVNYVYRIAKFEVTAGQYTTFLNAVAATDTYGLYNGSMWSNGMGCKIERTGSPGSYTYSVAPDWADRPVNFVSWGDAVRFANWLHNGQPTGAQDLTTTEDGAYFLGGAMTDTALGAVTRRPNATWVLPSRDEWHKAAYHYNDGPTGNYYGYPTGTDSEPSNQFVDPDPGNHATFRGPYGWTIGPPYYRTEVGAHEISASPYGTFDQGGNVYEWTEKGQGTSTRALLGGSAWSGYGTLHAQFTFLAYPNYQYEDAGFRVAKLR